MTSDRRKEQWTNERVDQYLFGQGVELRQYFISRASGADCLCYTSPEGRDFYLPIDDDALAGRAIQRLLALGVRIEEAG